MNLTSSDKRSINYFLRRLNGFLVADEMRIGKFGRTLTRFEKRFSFKIGLIDFKYYDEKRLMKVRKKMLKQEKIQNFGYMRNLAKLERTCLNYIELRKLFNFEKSVFLYEENYLLYCYCGNSRNDLNLLLWISLDERYVELKIRT
jgi:hypothetical protein